MSASRFGRFLLAAIAATSGTSCSRSPRSAAATSDGLRARLVFIEQRIVGLIVVTNRGGLLPLQLERALEQRPEPRKVVRLAGLDPQLLAEHRKFRQLLDQRLRQLRLPIVVALQIDDIRAGSAVPIGGERTVDQLGQPFANFGSGLLLVNEAGQKAHLLGPVFAAGRRQLGSLVPTE